MHGIYCNWSANTAPPDAQTQSQKPAAKPLLGGSWVVISGVISPLIWVITIVTLLITPLITNHEPPSRALGLRRAMPPRTTEKSRLNKK